MLTIATLSLFQFAALGVVYASIKYLRPSTRWWHTLSRLGNHKRRAILVCGSLTLAISIGNALVRWPVPGVHDEFSYLLAADTYASGRVTNPTHAMWQHFESFHVIHQPTYASKYPPVQGLLLAAGQRLTGDPVTGIFIGTTLVVMACCWMLQGWLPARWAFLGGLLMTFHPALQFNWGQGFMSPAGAIVGGALLFGALPRIMNRPTVSNAVVLGFGLVVLANSRPYEGLVVSLPVAVRLLIWACCARSPGWFDVVLRFALPVTLTLTLGGAAMALYNQAVTHDPLKMPYQLHEETYSVSPLFLWKSPREIPKFRHEVIRKFQLGWALDDYRRQRSLWGFWEAKSDMLVRIWYILVGPVLTVALLVGLADAAHRRDVAFLAGTVLVSLAAGTLVPWMFPHYVAPVLPALLVVLIHGLRRTRVWRSNGAARGGTVVTAMLATYLVVFCVGASGRAIVGHRQWSHDRTEISAMLRQLSGQHLVVVRYGPRHDTGREWVYNTADIDGAKIVWAREMSPRENLLLLEYFRNRRVWLLEADAEPPRLIEHRRVKQEGVAP